MFERYKTKIEAYCREAGVEIPVGFSRHSARRYAAIDLESEPPKLVATTWPKPEEAVYYLVNLAAGRRTRILDFRDRRELSFNGKTSLIQGDPF
ncbi:hypothetical protein [Variovorax sp. GT1P44]|uniref:hypothetical protein n=1 Tax=Variovorax sp. GT1P44 TaxID=3443742 RepID=UPI003F45C467